MLDGGVDAVGGNVGDEVAEVQRQAGERPDRYAVVLEEQGRNHAIDWRHPAVGETVAGDDDLELIVEVGVEAVDALLVIRDEVVGEGAETVESVAEVDRSVCGCGKESHCRCLLGQGLSWPMRNAGPLPGEVAEAA